MHQKILLYRMRWSSFSFAATAIKQCSKDVFNVLDFGIDRRQSARTKCIRGLTSLITSEVNAVLTDRESHVRIEIVRLHDKQVLTSHGTKVNFGNHEHFPPAAPLMASIGRTDSLSSAGERAITPTVAPAPASAGARTRPSPARD